MINRSLCGKIVTRFHMNIFLNRLAHGGTMGPRDRLIDAMERAQINSSTGHTSPTKSMAEATCGHLDITTRSVKVIPNGIPVESYRSSLRDCNIEPQEDYIFIPGRIEPNKGALVLAEALPPVLDAHPGLSALLVGRSVRTKHGDTKSLMLKRLGDHAGRVSFTGFIKHRRYLQMLAGARTVVIPSLWDNFPYTCLEAMCAGKTIVATRTGGMPEMMEDGVSGLLVSPGDEAMLADAINRCLDDDGLSKKLGSGALKRVKRFDIDATSSATLRFYRS